MRLRSVLFAISIGIVSAQFSNQWNPQQQQQQQQFNNGLQNNQQQQQQPVNQWGQPQQQQNGLGVGGQQIGAQMNGNQAGQQFRPGYGNLAAGAAVTTIKAAAPSIPNVNSPAKLSSNEVNGAQVDIQIKGYSNPNNLVSNSTTCSCSTTCTFLNADQQNACKFAFVTIISSADQSVQYYSTDFFAFNQQMDPRVGNWSAPISFQMTSKPVAIDVFVYQLGIAITLPDANRVQNLAFYDRLMLVDSFVVNVFTYNASTGTQVNDVLPGKIIGTSMSIAWSVKCINGMLGNNCNLVCGVTPDTYATTMSTNNAIIPPLRTAVTDGTTLCKDVVTGVYNSCRYNAGRTQVIDCTTCVNGVTPNNTCISVFTDVSQDDMVSYAFRTWTIVLGCLLGLAILVILCLIISYIIVRNRENEDEIDRKEYKPNPYNIPPAQQSTPASRPLLDDEWQTAPRRPIPPPPVHQQEHDRASDDSYRNNGHAATSQSRQEHQV